MSPTPAISVVMPVWNAAEYLDAAMSSIEHQTWRDFECVVVDDASTDGSRELALNWARRDARIRVVKNEHNLGISGAIARGMAAARAPWVARMDGDDVSPPERLARQMEAARRHPGSVLVVSPHDVLRADGRVVPGRRGICRQPELLPWLMLFYNRVGGGGQLFMSAEALRATGGYDPADGYSGDYTVLLRLLRLARPVVMRQAHYWWRTHNPNSQTRFQTFRYPEPSLAGSCAELKQVCGLDWSHEQVVAVRDFWYRYPDPATDWDEVQCMLLAAIQAFRPAYAIEGFHRQARIAVACGWWRNGIRAAAQKNRALVRGHLRRAREAAGWWLPRAVIRFCGEAAGVGGRLERLH